MYKDCENLNYTETLSLFNTQFEEKESFKLLPAIKVSTLGTFAKHFGNKNSFKF